MIPFDKIYTWLFKSFNISGYTSIIGKLKTEGATEIMIIKRSWIFALSTLWMPVCILGLSILSIFIAYSSIAIITIRNILIGGNIVMMIILLISSLSYIRYFRLVYHEAQIEADIERLQNELENGDQYFRSFFNWSLTNQWILILIIGIEIAVVIAYGQNIIGQHFWVLATDTLVIIIEIVLIRLYRKRMIDLEMDYNIVVPGKIIFVNQSGLLSSIQTLEGSKIKTIQSIFPSKMASFWDYGTITIITEGDHIMGTISMYYVTNPDSVVANIESLINRSESVHGPVSIESVPLGPKSLQNHTELIEHTIDTREQIRDILR